MEKLNPLFPQKTSNQENKANMDRLNVIKQEIAAKQQVVYQLKREMDALYQDYDDKWTNMEPKPPRHVEADLEAIAWEKETMWTQAKHELSLLHIAHLKQTNLIATLKQKSDAVKKQQAQAQAQQDQAQQDQAQQDQAQAQQAQAQAQAQAQQDQDQ
jgi:hypothetical protein